VIPFKEITTLETRRYLMRSGLTGCICMFTFWHATNSWE